LEEKLQKHDEENQLKLLPEEKFYRRTADEALVALHSDLEGLKSEEAEQRLQCFGTNTLQEEAGKSVLSVLLAQFKDLLVIILIIAALVSIATGNVESTIVILVVITLNAILGTVQYFKAEKSLKSLKELSSPFAGVFRDGIKCAIHSRDVVPGDIIFLEAGDLVVADARIVENHSLQVNESSLTGESESVNKIKEPLDKEEMALGDQENMLFAGSLITYGRALAVVTATGMNTELGKIAGLLNTTPEKKTPLQVSLDDFSKKLSITIIVICALVFGLCIYRTMPILDAMMFAVALAVAAIPEALSSIITIVLALGTQKMADENAIVKELKSVESLGCVSIICSDKTGTLTKNKMTVKKIFVDGRIIDESDIDTTDPMQSLLIYMGVLCNDSALAGDKAIGDPTEIALLDLARRNQLDEEKIKEELPRLAELPFDSERKLMSTLHILDGRITMVTKGAVDVLVRELDSILDHKGIYPVFEEEKAAILEANEHFSKQGLRVLAFAYKELPLARDLVIDDEKGYTFLGLIAMMDPPRDESAAAVADCRRAGIKPVMITGDHRTTAAAIANQIGILQEGDIAIDGVSLDKLSDIELDNMLEKISVYARVSPAHKIRIVDAWQKKGHIVAMTGDGVNDAPALKKSDIGIAMGITGTQVSKDAASMILTDDNFATIIKAVTNGRNIYANIKNAIQFLLSGNMSGILSVLYASLMALPMPFAAVHLLFINLLTDSLPAIAIGMEKSRRDLLDDKPRPSKESIMTKEYMQTICLQGGLIAIFTMISFYYGLANSIAQASTMAFATLCLSRLFHGFNCRAKKSIFRLGLFTNMASIIAFALGLLLLNGVLFVPALQRLFEVAPLDYLHIGFIYLMAFAPTFLIQIRRVIAESRFWNSPHKKD